MNTSNPLKALLSAPFIKTSLWSTSQVFRASATVCSAMLITWSSNLAMAFCINFFLILWITSQKCRWFFIGRSFPNELDLDLGCSQSNSASACSMTFISWSLIDSPLCGQVSSLFDFAPALPEPQVQPLTSAPGFFPCFTATDFDCVYKTQLVLTCVSVDCHRFLPWSIETFRSGDWFVKQWFSVTNCTQQHSVVL